MTDSRNHSVPREPTPRSTERLGLKITRREVIETVGAAAAGGAATWAITNFANRVSPMQSMLLAEYMAEFGVDWQNLLQSATDLQLSLKFMKQHLRGYDALSGYDFQNIDPVQAPPSPYDANSTYDAFKAMSEYLPAILDQLEQLIPAESTGPIEQKGNYGDVDTGDQARVAVALGGLYHSISHVGFLLTGETIGTHALPFRGVDAVSVYASDFIDVTTGLQQVLPKVSRRSYGSEVPISGEERRVFDDPVACAKVLSERIRAAVHQLDTLLNKNEVTNVIQGRLKDQKAAQNTAAGLR